MLKKVRSFFEEREVLELDCPILNSTANIDDSIDPIKVKFCESKIGYLHTSPELFMKKLLARGIGDSYFLGHVFRDHEKGEHHHTEFTMVEWYRQKLDYPALINETIDFVKLFVDVNQIQTFSYREILLEKTGIDYVDASLQELKDYVQENLNFKVDLSKESYTDLLIIIFTEKVEPCFEKYELVVLKDYPKDQSALAKLQIIEGVEVAKRFELYYRGIELANGYDELVGDQELYERYIASNKKRELLNKEVLPIDEQFIAANAELPQCTGVAVGFDRLMMLRHNNSSIHSTMALVD
ncbi:MAG: Elongation factor P--(R)-beta-lysine ligase [Chlamydiae bacterium]|nr:Elongation factor P--(R)-beta-lysine ligase [Chlamydiota bacterium]